MANTEQILAFLALISTLGFIAGIIFLQVYLSKQNSKWPGLILPIFIFCSGLLSVTGFIIRHNANNVSSVTMRNETAIIELEGIVGDREAMETYYRQSAGTVTLHLFDEGGIMVDNIFLIVLLFTSIINIPTAFLLIIYAICRSKRKKLLALNKMNLQDL